MKGSAKKIARQALEEVEGDPAAAYAHVVRALESRALSRPWIEAASIQGLDRAYSLKIHEAWKRLARRELHKEDSVDGVLVELRRYLRVLGVTTTVAAENILRESLIATLPEDVQKAIRVFEEDGRQLPLPDVVAKARAQLKTYSGEKKLAAGAVTGGQYCYICETTGHIAAECRERGATRPISKPKGKGKGKGPRCYTCQKYGHIAEDCKNKQSKAGAAIENDFVQAEQPMGGVVLHL
ncbi:hypothetical protein Pmar_PMAR009242 [Perkinsus marinus ATCC 50983]|uniref:CCHC-type domain-containing protein n=1 Tax=Perkinsus marinus (strain ATCC 50983 / TXsc) TaxID=423536 RepID=C5M0D8_PERM5|nr:hypothetical protein Pmar_PMAR009242 [Perkinsus marinus ATCC 50983]EEQ97545.1 hypothetical protein Pmar_PMAR009242 [Perkinsus marinus ATCC 50983]|eukprot:XP_002764828.1 hypothetical protein Pmar_PMAR009242 [Perkinsus marinus ATCC 50983]